MDLLAIHFRCWNCNARIRADARLAGHRRHCPGCKRTLVVPWSPPDEQGPVLADDTLPVIARQPRVGR